MKNIILTSILLTLFSTICIGQENKNMSLIRLFYERVYDSQDDAGQLVKNYIVYTDSVGYKNAVKSILSLRLPDDQIDEHFSVLRNDIKNGEFIISDYNRFSDDEKAKFKYLNKSDHPYIYRLNPKNTNRQYILIQEDKIRSFLGFQKSRSENYTFIVY